MIDGVGGGSGQYSFRRASAGKSEVRVSHMPEDDFTVSITFVSQFEDAIPKVKINERLAECLWVALSDMAKDLKWKGADYLREREK